MNSTKFEALNYDLFVSVGPHGVPAAWEPDKLQALALSRPSEALAVAREVLAQHPSASHAAVAHQAVGVVFRNHGDIGEAIEEFRIACRFARKAGNPDHESDIQASLGIAWVLAGRTRRGIVASWTPWCSTAVASRRARS